MALKRIAFFSGGDSQSLSTWSNVPYLFARTLESKGYELVRVDYSPNRILEKIYNTLMYYIYVKIGRKSNCPVYARTRLNHFLTYRLIKKVTSAMDDVDMNFFLTYELYNPYSTKPTVIWSDWSDEISILRKNGFISKYENFIVNKEREAIKKADLMYTMFPMCKVQMEEMYDREIFYLDRNVINNVYNKKISIEDICLKRISSEKLLFIGNHRYKGAALQLIKAYFDLRKKHVNLELHIVGMTPNELDIRPEHKGVYCYGYLRKDNIEERNLYYELLMSSKVIINPATVWGAYSSIVEAMFFGCPVIISPFRDFVKEFGEIIDFGFYCNRSNMKEKINELLESQDYMAMCRAAHNRVADYTWDKYVDCFLEHVRSQGIDI